MEKEGEKTVYIGSFICLTPELLQKDDEEEFFKDIFQDFKDAYKNEDINNKSEVTSSGSKIEGLSGYQILEHPNKEEIKEIDEINELDKGRGGIGLGALTTTLGNNCVIV